MFNTTIQRQSLYEETERSAPMEKHNFVSTQISRQTWCSLMSATAAIFVFSSASSLTWGDTLWEKTAGPPGLTVTVIYKANSVVYAGTDTQGIYKSTDDGLNWTAANNGIERASIHDIISSGGNLLVAGSSTCSSFNNVFKSTDNGATWSTTSGLSGKIALSFAIKGSV